MALLLSLGLAILPTKSVFGAGELPPSTGTSYIWTGSGTTSLWSNSGNWYINGTNQVPGTGSTKIIFGFVYPGFTPDSEYVDLGAVSRSVGEINVQSGNYTFNLVNGSSTRTLKGALVLGSAGYNPKVTFQGNGKVTLSGLQLGADGSAGNQIGNGLGEAVSFSGVTLDWNTSGLVKTGLEVGSENGGINNVFRITAGSSFDGAIFEAPNKAAILYSGSTTGASQNRIEVDGGTLTLNGDLDIQGSGVAGVNANNEFSVKNGGQVNIVGGINVAAGSHFIVDGINSLFSKPSVAASINNDFIISGKAEVTNGGQVDFQGLKATVNSGAMLKLDGGIANFGAMDLSGRLTLVNNSSSEVGGSLRILSPDVVVVVDETSTFTTGPLDLNVDGSGNTTSKLTLQGGGELYAQGSLNIRKGSQGYSAGETLIEAKDGSVLRVDTLYIDARGHDNYIPIQGKVIVGAGGFSVTSNKSDDQAVLTVGAGTHLQLDGGTYGLAWGTNADGGRLYVEAGGTLSGYGTLRAGLNLEGGRLLVGDGVEPRLFAVGTLSYANSFTDASFSFNLFDEFGSSDQLQSLYSINFQGTQTLSVNFLGDASALDAEYTTYQLFLNSSGEPLNVGNFNYDFSESSPILAAAGLAWNTTDFSSTGTLKLAEVAALSFTPQDGESLGHSSTLEVVNDSTTKSAKILEARTSNASWAVTGLADGTNLAAGGSANATATTQFVDQELALNGTHKATLTVQVDHDLSNANPDIHDIVTHRWDLSETVSDQVAAYGVGGRTETYLAHVDEGNRYEGFSLTSEDGTMAAFLSGQATSQVTLQMSFDHTTGSFLGGSSSGPTFLSDVVNVEVLDSATLEAMTNPFVLNLQFTGDYNDGDALWLGYSSVFDSTGSFDLVDWANVGMDEYYVGSYESYLSDYGSDLLPGVWGFDATTKSIWAVVNQSGSYAAFSGGIVPEPSRVTLLTAGLALLIFRRKRKAGTC